MGDSEDTGGAEGVSDELMEKIVNMMEADDGWDSPLGVVAVYVGQLCQSWAHLEFDVSVLLCRCLKLPDTRASIVTAQCFDFRHQLKAIKVAAVFSKRSEAWKTEVIETADYIDNVIRPRRNRLVHDLWFDERGASEFHRGITSPVIGRPQARKPRKVTLPTEAEDLSRIADAITDTREFGAYVHALSLSITQPRKMTLAALLRERPARRLQPPRPEKPHPSGKAPKEP